MLRGFFLIGIISFYSHGLFKMINEYFRTEYKTYLAEEYKRNKNLMPNSEVPIQLMKSENEMLKDMPKSFNLPPDNEQTLGESNANCKNENELLKSINSFGKQLPDDEHIVSYWLDRNRNDLSNNEGRNDAYCQVDNVKCKNN